MTLPGCSLTRLESQSSMKHFTEDEAVRELIENGLPEAVARTRVEVHRGFSTGAFAEVTGNVQTLLHRAPRSFAEFARDYTSAFR
jgi:hypothetical protein